MSRRGPSRLRKIAAELEARYKKGPIVPEINMLGVEGMPRELWVALNALEGAACDLEELGVEDVDEEIGGLAITAVDEDGDGFVITTEDGERWQ